MKLLKFTLPLVIAVVITILYLLQACGGVHYNSYVEDYKDIAIEEMIRTGYPASIKLAQAILESEGGRSELAIDHNNHFSILCDSKWKGSKHRVTEVDFATGEKFESCYKVYDNPITSFIAHTNILKKDPHYKSLFQLKSSNYVLWAERLMELEYTNNETYDLTLINMIEKYNLDAYDNIALGYDPEIADESNHKIEEEDIPTTFDHQDDQIIDHLKAKEERTRINIENQLANLENDITDHKSKFSEENASWKRELEEQLNDSYAGRDYEEAGRSSYPTRAERYTSTSTPTYNQRTNKQQSGPRNAMDAKYKDLYKTDYPTSNRRRTYEEPITQPYAESNNNRRRPTYQEPITQPYAEPNNSRRRPTYQEPITQPYAEPNNSRRRPTYQETTTAMQDEDSWLSTSSEETSMSDFADDYTYINGSIVVYARYNDSPLIIAKRYNVSVKDIINFNESIKNNSQRLKEGMSVFLEAKKKNYLNGDKYHIVQTGETMENIAATYGLLLNELYAKNRMPMGSQPALGERIKLDKGKIKQRPELRSNYRNEYQNSESTAPPSSVALDDYDAAKSNRINQSTYYNQKQPVTTVLLEPATTNQKYHTVIAGEAIYGIAKRYGLSSDQLMRMNGLRSEKINRGMRLIIR